MDRFQADLKESMERLLQGFYVPSYPSGGELLDKARALLVERLMVEVAEGRIEPDTLEIDLYIDEETNRLKIGFLPVRKDEHMNETEILVVDDSYREKMEERFVEIFADVQGQAITPMLLDQMKQRMTSFLLDDVQPGDIEDELMVDVVRALDDPNGIDWCVRPKVIDAETFARVVGRLPQQDELHRCNCEEAGTVGHLFCGWCPHCNKPRFICGHLAERR